MSTAQLFVDAIHTALTVYRWAVGWVITLATVGSILIVAATVTGARGAGAAWQALRRRRSPEPVPHAPEPPRKRPVPSWAHTEPYRYDEAA